MRASVKIWAAVDVALMAGALALGAVVLPAVTANATAETPGPPLTLEPCVMGDTAPLGGCIYDRDLNAGMGDSFISYKGETYIIARTVSNP